jgi:ABC-2 type transport system ATP-binding protein
MDALKIELLSKQYDTFLLDNVSFSIPKGYIMGFIGENGAGKTTTIKSMLNLVKRDSGKITIFDKDIDQDEFSIKLNIGYVSGNIFYPKKKISEITKVYKRFFKTWDEALYTTLLSKFSLIESKRVDELSKGMQLKYLITLALSHHAELLILDEPTSGLDPVARDEVLEIFQGIVENEEASIFFSTHITSDLEKCADYITFIKNGRIIESCSKDDMLDKYRIIQGTKNQLVDVKTRLIAYKENAFGFLGLMKTSDLKEDDSIQHGQASLDDIMIYYAIKEHK